MSELDDIAQGFTDKLLGLTKLMVEYLPNDPDAVRLQRRLAYAKSSGNFIDEVIAKGGKLLNNHYDAIMSDDPQSWASFYTRPDAFDSEIASAKSGDAKSIASSLIPKIQAVVGGMDLAKQREIIAILRELIDDYLLYTE